MTPSLEQLWELTGIDRAACVESENLYFDPIGLNLLKSPVCWEYWCTPTNTISFATTHGDGVHFGFLCESGQPTDSSPIVMTLPSANTSNIIVGENFKEFLSLGCRVGFFELEQIEYQPDRYLPFMDTHAYSEDATPSEIQMLKAIESRFSLTPWSRHRSRLSELKLKYYGYLNYSEEYYEITT